MQQQWRIRKATSEDWRALRMLLPQAVHFGAGVISYVAMDAADRIVAAAAVSPRLRSLPVVGPRILLHVVSPLRRQGIGKALVETCSHALGAAGAAALYAWEAVEAESEMRSIWRALGFSEGVELLEGRSDVEKIREYLKPLYEQVVEHDYIPAEARMVPLGAAYAEQIAKLHAKYLGGDERDIAAALKTADAHRYQPALSPVLLMGDRVMGFTLCEQTAAAEAFVHGTVVHPDLRGGWANLWVKYDGICHASQMKIATLLHHTYAHHTDTRKFTRQVGVTVRKLVEPYRLLNPPRLVSSPAPVRH